MMTQRSDVIYFFSGYIYPEKAILAMQLEVDFFTKFTVELYKQIFEGRGRRIKNGTKEVN